LLLLAACATRHPAAPADSWRGVHLWLDREASAQALIETLPALARAGANTVVIEVNYSFEFRRHPELRNAHFLTRATAHALAAAARRSGIRLIPEFNCLGHQSFGGRVEPLLRLHPEFSETPLAAMRETNFYSLCWCPRAPEVNEIVFSLIDEIAEGFEAKAIHVGLDEVYYLGEDRCPRCRGANPAELFEAEVNALHAHIVGEKKWQMLMWADRVIGPKYQGYSRFDTARNDVSTVLDQLPKDIVMCDWHYEWKKDFACGRRVFCRCQRSRSSARLLARKTIRAYSAGWRRRGTKPAFAKRRNGHPSRRFCHAGRRCRGRGKINYKSSRLLTPWARPSRYSRFQRELPCTGLAGRP